MNEESITVERFYNKNTAAVWHAITNVEALAKWFLPGSFKALPGFVYNFEGGENSVKGTVLEVVEQKLLVYTWVKGDTEIETTVRWELEPKDGGTLLKIHHTGIEKYTQTVPWLIQNTQQGWHYVIGAIENYLTEDHDV